MLVFTQQHSNIESSTSSPHAYSPQFPSEQPIYGVGISFLFSFPVFPIFTNVVLRYSPENIQHLWTCTHSYILKACDLFLKREKHYNLYTEVGTPVWRICHQQRW